MDPLRDDGIIYEQMLREENDVDTKMDIFPGLPHCWWTKLPELQATKDFGVKVSHAVRWLLERVD